MKRRKEISARFRIFILALIGLIVVTIWASTRAASNAVYQVPRLIETGNTANRAFIRNDTLFTDSMAVSVHNIVLALNKVQTDTLEGSGTIMGIGSDTTFFDIDSSGTNVVLWFGNHGAAIKWQRSTDSLYWTINGTTWTSFGTGSGGDCGSCTDTDQDSTFVVHYSSRWAPLPDSNAQYFGNVSDSAIFLIDRDEDYAVFYTPLYKFDPSVSDSEYITRAEANTLTGSTGDIEGVTAGTGLSGGGTSGTVTLNVLWTWLWGFIDTTTAKIPTATLADSAVKYDTANALNWTEVRTEIKNGAEIYAKIDTTAAKIPTASVADSAIKSDTSITVQWAEMRQEIKNGAEIYNKIDTTAAKIPTATLADSSAGGATRATRAAVADSAVKSDTSIIVDWTELRTEIKNRAEIYNKIDTTTAKIPTATLADSSVKYDTANVVNWTELRTEIKNGAETYNRIDTTSAKIPTASLADSCVKYDTANVVNWTELRTEIKNGAENYNKIDTTTAKIPTASLADSANGGAIRAETAKTVIANSIDSTKITNSSVGNEDLNTGSVNSAKILDGSVTGTDIANQTIGQADVDSSANISVARIYANKAIHADTLKVYNADSNLVLGSGNYISFGSGAVSVLDGLTDDSLVQEWNPEYPNMVLLTRFVSGNDIDTAYVDSMKIYGGGDSLYGNYMIFHDSTLNAGKHRRHIQLEIPVPDRVDSLRRITLECLSNTYSAGATEFFTVAGLFSRPCAKSNIDSAIGGSVLDRDSSAATSLTTIHLTGTWPVSPFDSRYLVISGRRDAGTAFLYSKIYKIRAVWSRTRL